MSRPSFAATISALRTTDPRFPWVGPTEDESEVASVLEEIAEHHVGSADEPDARGGYGRCTGCKDPWPCASWAYGEELALQWLGRAANRVWMHAQPVLEQLAERDRRAA